jgi:hypothetical protein
MAEWVSGTNGFEFELLGGCGEYGKSLANAQLITRNIYYLIFRVVTKMYKF